MLRMLLLIVAQVLLSLGGLYKIKTSSEIVSTEFMIGLYYQNVCFVDCFSYSHFFKYCFVSIGWILSS